MLASENKYDRRGDASASFRRRRRAAGGDECVISLCAGFQADDGDMRSDDRRACRAMTCNSRRGGRAVLIAPI